jgi:hypothetical protein
MKCNFTCHDTFDLRPLEGTLICLCRTLLGERFGGTILAWPFIGVGIPQVGCHDLHTLEVIDDGRCLSRQ